MSDFTDNSFLLSHIYVSPEHRKKGIGYSLMKEALKEANELNLSFISLITKKDETQAINLAKKFGFVFSYDYCNDAKNIIMARQLDNDRPVMLITKEK